MWPYLASIWRSRHFWLSLVGNDVQRRYRNSFVGIGWSLLHPLATAAVTGWVFHQLFDLPLGSFLPFVLSGLACWAFISAVTIQGCDSYLQAESYIRQHPLPLAIYPLRVALGAMIHFLIALGLVCVLSRVLGGSLTAAGVLLALPGLGLFLLCGWAVATLVGFAHAVFRDTQHMLEVAVQIFFYLTPILYPGQAAARTRIGAVLNCNPLTHFLNLIREPLLEGRPPSLTSYAVAAAVTLVCGGAAVATLGHQQRRVVFYL